MKVLFWANSPCIRTYKEAKALRSRGLVTVLAHTGREISDRYPGLDAADAFDDVVKAGAMNPYHYVDDKKIDVIHTAHPPDDSVRILKGCGVPVVHDFHDMYSLETDDPALRRHEADAATHADGLVYVTGRMEEYAASMYPNRTPVSRVVANAADDVEFERLPRPWPEGEIHIVYVAALPRWNEGHFRDLKWLVDILAPQEVHLHVHAIIRRHDLLDAARDNPFLHIEETAIGPRMVSLLTRYDAGIWHQRSFGSGPESVRTRRLLDLCSPNKIYEYWQAGIPVICCTARDPAKVVSRYRIGQVVKTWRNIRPIIERPYCPVREPITMREEAAKLVSLYEEVLGL